MKTLLGLLLVMGIVGCGGGEPHPFKQLGAWINRNEQGEIVEVSQFQRETTDAILVHLKGLNNLKSLSLGMTKVTDAGLVHLKGLMELQELNLGDAKVTDAGVADLQKALPNCNIVK